MGNPCLIVELHADYPPSFRVRLDLVTAGLRLSYGLPSPLQCAADLDPCCAAKWLRREIRIWGRTRCLEIMNGPTLRKSLLKSAELAEDGDSHCWPCASARIVAGLGDGRRLLVADAGRLRSRWVGHHCRWIGAVDVIQRRLDGGAVEIGQLWTLQASSDAGMDAFGFGNPCCWRQTTMLVDLLLVGHRS
ncbi:hypothetical protein ACLOJK_006842 [Asimina triloba]